MDIKQPLLVNLKRIDSTDTFSLIYRKLAAPSETVDTVLTLSIYNCF